MAAGLNFNLALVATEPLLWPRPKASIALVRGASTTLTIGVRPKNPFTCQWFFNDSPSPGATATNLQVDDFDLAQAGSYSVAVTNPFGSSTATTVLRLTNSPVVLIERGGSWAGDRRIGVRRIMVVITNIFSSGRRHLLHAGRPAPLPSLRCPT